MTHVDLSDLINHPIVIGTEFDEQHQCWTVKAAVVNFTTPEEAVAAANELKRVLIDEYEHRG